MKVVRKLSLWDMSIIKEISVGTIITWFGVCVVGFVLFQSPLFSWNLPAMIAYFALALIIAGKTPTKRNTISNVYGVLFKKPTKMVVSQLATITTLGHGIKDVEIDNDGHVEFKLANRNSAMVFRVTSNISNWSNDDDYIRQATAMKTLFNIMDPNEMLLTVLKLDSDASMDSLRKELEQHEKWEGDDFAMLSDRRIGLLKEAASNPLAKSMQQYIILEYKPRNKQRLIQQLERCCATMQPATYPGDVLLAAFGFEVYEEDLMMGGDTDAV